MSIVICALIHDNKILLIERAKGDYVGLLGLPGGKIEKDEHFSTAAIREVHEESGIDPDFKEYLGLVSEHLLDENGKVAEHFLLHICLLVSKAVKITNGEEGKLGWFDLSELGNIKNKVIPSDFIIIDRMVKNHGKNYFDCVIRRESDKYLLEKFE